ncbi:MAG: VanY domain-containing protein [Oscillospiraceae bacterium]|jgi:zinc D-Ala-D-Ala carboxypeptidase
MKRRREKVLKTHPQWRSQNQMKKLKIVMTVIVIAIFLSAAAAGLLAWSQLRVWLKEPTADVAMLSSDGGSTETDELPVYDDALNLMLVNVSQPLESGYQPQLTSFDGYQVDERILPALKKMMEQAEADGCPLTLSGGYVSVDEQNQLYQAEVQRLMQEENQSRVRAENEAQSTIGKGGYNENQTGLAVTFSADGKQGAEFASTKQYRWLSQNSVYYGFILRFPENKESMTGVSFQPDHFRYVGTKHAIKMREYSLCLEEYVTYLKQQAQN